MTSERREADQRWKLPETLDVSGELQIVDGRAIALVITKTGRAAINADDDDRLVETEAAIKSVSKAPSKPIRAGASSTKSSSQQANKASDFAGVKDRAQPGARPGSKQAKVIDLLSRKQGATMDAMIAATGWLPHTTRAMLTGLRKKGFVLERMREEGVTTYRMTGRPEAAAV